MLAVLLSCGLRRHEAVELNFSHLQQREQHWAIVDLVGKAGPTRTVPMPDSVKLVLDDWLNAAGLASGRVFRRVNRAGRVWGEGMTGKAVWHVSLRLNGSRPNWNPTIIAVSPRAGCKASEAGEPAVSCTIT
jgi:integrase